MSGIGKRHPQGGGYSVLYPKRPPRLRRIFANNPVFFVTFCTHRRRKILATDSVNAAFIQFGMRAYEQNNIAVGRYVVMPDDFQLGRWVGMLKQSLGKVITAARAPVWQRGFFDHVLRSDESYGQKWTYIRENPVRAGLVRNAEDWTYSGELVIIDRA